MQLLQAQLAAGTGPDVFFVMDGFTVGFAARGILVPIDSYVDANPDVDLEDNYDWSYQGAPLARSTLGFTA